MIRIWDSPEQLSKANRMDRICWHVINLGVNRLFRVVFFIVFVENTRECAWRGLDRASNTSSGCHFLLETRGIFFHHDGQTKDTLLQVTRESGVWA